MSFDGKGLWRLIAVPAVVVPILVLSCASPPVATPTTSPTTPAPSSAPPRTILPPPPGDPAAGEQVFNAQGCSGCHIAKGTGGQVGPKLDGLYGSMVPQTTSQQVLADATYIRNCITNPSTRKVAGYQDVMPTTFSSLPAQDLTNLIAFVASLK